MKRILLEVNDKTAKTCKNIPAKLREQTGKNLEELLSDSLSKVGEANFELLLKDAREEASKNGLTEEILAALLDEEDWKFCVRHQYTR